MHNLALAGVFLLAACGQSETDRESDRQANLANPDPTKTVSWGDQTFEEMMIGYVDYYDDETLPPGTGTVAVNPAR